MSVYDRQFYNSIREGSLRSAREVAPFVYDIFRPKSVIDLGCGIGAWLAAFKECGAEDICGVDGSHVDTKSLLISSELFRSADLSKPIKIGRRFNLAISVEVAEHLPASSARQFVRSLVELAPVVMFSAAIPFQGGTGHRNERWPSYWGKMFNEMSYHAVDCLRPIFWHNSRVEWWYSQNLCLYISREELEHFPALRDREVEGAKIPSLIHPENYLAKIGELLKAKDSSPT